MHFVRMLISKTHIWQLSLLVSRANLWPIISCWTAAKIKRYERYDHFFLMSRYNVNWYSDILKNIWPILIILTITAEVITILYCYRLEWQCTFSCLRLNQPKIIDTQTNTESKFVCLGNWTLCETSAQKINK